jgi:hypothetical protein
MGYGLSLNDPDMESVPFVATNGKDDFGTHLVF